MTSYARGLLSNSTVSGNTASINGGGIRNWSGTTTLGSSIVSGNAAPSGSEVWNNAPFNAASYNVFGHDGETSAQAFYNFTPSGSDVIATSDGTTPTALNLILNTTLANNGGPTQNHALVANSPAIDLDAACSTGLSTDQRSAPRPSGAGCDAGAYEFGSTPTGVNDIDDDLMLDLYDNCPYTYNPDQKDSDRDGVGDACCQSGNVRPANLMPVYQLLLRKGR